MRIILFVFLGGAIGAMCREGLMLFVPAMSDHFPLDIFIANIVASFLLGITAGLLSRKLIGDAANAFIATGIMGGLSTFSSFMYGSVEIMNSGFWWVGISYVIISIVAGFIAVFCGYALGDKVH